MALSQADVLAGLKEIVEERFGVKIPDDQVAELATVGDAVDFIVKASA